MTLIKSISGIRGTIGGEPGEALTPTDILKFAAAYGTWLTRKHKGQPLKVVIGRDARISGEMVYGIVSSTLIGMGIDVVNAGLSTTPTVEMAVVEEGAQGGIILTASHNPAEWNALKLLNHKGEFISADDGSLLLSIAEKEEFDFVAVDKLGKIVDKDFIDYHIKKILELPLVNVDAIKAKNFKVVIDCVNSSGGVAVPRLLKALGVQNITELYCEPNGIFPHNPEPLPENLKDISDTVKREKAHLGIVVDPDVDRLALISENGEMFGEEYTLVAVADYILQHQSGNTVSNLSSTRALGDITEVYGGIYSASAVGEVNVVEKMKEVKAIIGGEGNGGVIYPDLHYGRDALAGIALFLSHLASSGNTMSQLRASYPNYFISKNKIELSKGVNVDALLKEVEERYKNEKINKTDGVKIDFEKEWVHLRRSNTEPIIRVYSESSSKEAADAIAKRVMDDIRSLIQA